MSCSMRPRIHRVAPSASAVATYCRLSSSRSYEDDPDSERRFDTRRFTTPPTLDARESSSRAQDCSPSSDPHTRRDWSVLPAQRRLEVVVPPQRGAAPQHPRVDHVLIGELRLGLPLVLELAGSLELRGRTSGQPAEVPLVLAGELHRVAPEDAPRRCLRPAEEHLVGDQVGLPQVADVVQVEPGRIPVKVVEEAQPAGVGAAEAHQAPVAAQRGAVRVHSQVARVGPLVVVDRVRLEGLDGLPVAPHVAEDAARLEDPGPVGEVPGEVEPAGDGLGGQEGKRGVGHPPVGRGQHPAEARVALVPVLVEARDGVAAERLDDRVPIAERGCDGHRLLLGEGLEGGDRKPPVRLPGHLERAQDRGALRQARRLARGEDGEPGRRLRRCDASRRAGRPPRSRSSGSCAPRGRTASSPRRTSRRR